MIVGQSAGWRPKNARMVEWANRIIDATGVCVTDLVELAFQYGLAKAQEELVRQREEEYARQRLALSKLKNGGANLVEQSREMAEKAERLAQGQKPQRGRRSPSDS